MRLSKVPAILNQVSKDMHSEAEGSYIVAGVHATIITGAVQQSARALLGDSRSSSCDSYATARIKGVI